MTTKESSQSTAPPLSFYSLHRETYSVTAGNGGGRSQDSGFLFAASRDVQRDDATASVTVSSPTCTFLFAASRDVLRDALVMIPGASIWLAFLFAASRDVQRDPTLTTTESPTAPTRFLFAASRDVQRDRPRHHHRLQRTARCFYSLHRETFSVTGGIMRSIKMWTVSIRCIARRTA